MFNAAFVEQQEAVKLKHVFERGKKAFKGNSNVKLWNGGCTKRCVPFMCGSDGKNRITTSNEGSQIEGSKTYRGCIYILMTVMLLFVVIAHIYRFLYYMLMINEQIERI